MHIKHIDLLLVEDDVADRKLLQVFLGQLSPTLEFTVTTAESLAEGLSALQSKDFDLVLLDLNLPDSQGLGTVETICADCAHAPVVVLTGLADEQVGIEAIKRGASDYVVKGEGVKDILYRAICYSLERKQIEKQLRESEAQVRQVCAELETKTYELLTANRDWEESFDSINDAITIHSADFEIIRANRAAQQLLNLPLEQIVGHKCHQVYHGRACPPEGCPSCDILTSGQACDFEVFETHLNKFIHLRAMPRFNAENEIAGLVHIVQDISTSKQAEEEREQLQAHLRQTQKLEAIGTLAGGIAHDFNNILMAMLGYTDLTLQELPEASQGRHNLEQVLIAGNRAKELVKQILCFSRKADQIQEPIEIAPVVAEALRMLRSSIPPIIDIHQDIEATGSFIMANSTQIHQVLVNLCTNAVHAMEGQGGTLTLRLSETDIRSTHATRHGTLQPGPYVQLTVHDTGCGMDEEVIARIFEPFYTTKGVDKGTGMGLSVVHGIVQGHGGVITVDSEPGRGTTFTVFVPRVVHAGTSEAVSSEIGAGQGEAILLVDDESAIVDVMTRMLERLGYTVIGQTTGTGALDLFRSAPAEFDLVITDHAMPVMTGTQLAQALMDIRSDIPVILCSGFADDVTGEEATHMGIRAFVAKPVVGKEMAVLIRRLLDKKEVNV